MSYRKQNRRKIIEDYLEEIESSLEKKDLTKVEKKEKESSLEEKEKLTYGIYKLGIEYFKNYELNYLNISDVCANMRVAVHEFGKRMNLKLLEQDILDNYKDKKELRIKI
jgi:hypothetical protein